MNKPSFYISCADENDTTVYAGPTPDESNGLTALMTNPSASASVLIDAAYARANRIRDLSAPFSYLTPESVDNIPGDVIAGFINAMSSMSHEVTRILLAAQNCQRWPSKKESSDE